MGRSAKAHKRVNKKSTSGTPAAASGSRAKAPQAQVQVQAAKKKAGLKDKAKGKSIADEGLLGGADYVSLMMGGRRKAKTEAGKLAQASE
ncbi:hypothetical protein FIBSPDRAFT_955888 [Athelia psychrophila]|uniref:Uncharacterized protein n=1 Tax=Athelia psychrophila TaxID=1759441 RepID=A0A166HJI7_9AGAM|nr:hypothetical protein FIBSPDRAFT_955888 [Fibularhizoctonia sp. CBS 109695]